jgi:hypothetical protein
MNADLEDRWADMAEEAYEDDTRAQLGGRHALALAGDAQQDNRYLAAAHDVLVASDLPSSTPDALGGGQVNAEPPMEVPR